MVSSENTEAAETETSQTMTKLFSMILLAAMATSSTAFVVPTPSLSVTAQTQHTSSPSTRQQNQLWMSTATDKKQPGTAKMDTEWENLGFEFRPTNSHVKIMYKDGEWSKPELVKVRLCYTFI